MAARDPLEWHFKQLDHTVGLSFKTSFHFALVGHLLKGFRHLTPTTVSRTTRVLNMLLAIVAKPNKRDKFEVTPQSVAYLSALVSVSEEVRGRCHARLPRLRSNNSSGSGGNGCSGGSDPSSGNDSNIDPGDPFSVADLRLDLHSAGIQQRQTMNNQVGGGSQNSAPLPAAATSMITSGAGNLSPVSIYSTASTCALLHTSASHNALSSIQGSTLNSPISSGGNSAHSSTTHLLVPLGISGSCSSQTALIPNMENNLDSPPPPPPGGRQASWDLLDQNAISQAKQRQQQHQSAASYQQQGDELSSKAQFKTQRSFSVPTTRDPRTLERNPSGTKTSGERSQSPTQQAAGNTTSTPPASCPPRRSGEGGGDRGERGGSVSGESNCLLDPEILTNFPTQALVLTVLATLVKYTTDENEMRVLYEYLAEASVVFPRVFPIIHSLLDAKITNVLSLCHDQGILAAVQRIIQNMIALEGAGGGEQQQQLHYLQSCGFGGLWRFAGPFTKSNCTAESAELFVNCLEALVETCLPAEEGEADLAPFPSMLSVSSNMNLSSSLSSITMGSPTDKAK